MAAPENPQSDDARLTRLEEALSFADRAGEHLSNEIAELNRRVTALTKRVASLEERLRKAESGEEETPEA